MGDDLGKRNAADRKAEERYQIRRVENCPSELDKPVSYGDDGNEIYMELEDETADILSIIEDKERLDALLSTLDRLAPDYRELWDCLVNKIKKQDIADRFNITLDGVYYREKRLKSIIRGDAKLKALYEKD
jgi:DNA-directed RNA polymerase specialized sigma24 family protein